MLYVLQDRDFYKVGISSDMKKRIQHYETHNPHFKLLRTYEMYNKVDKYLETVILKFLKGEFSSKKDWIKMTANNAKALLKYLDWMHTQMHSTEEERTQHKVLRVVDGKLKVMDFYKANPEFYE